MRADPAALTAKCTYVERAGCFLVPTLLMGATPAMRCMSEEIFGTVLPVVSATADAALAMMDDTKYGLTASVWTKDAAVATKFLEGMTVGVCYENWANDVHMHVPWTGVRLSGNGQGGIGNEGFRVLTTPKGYVRRAAPMPWGPAP